MGDPTTVGEEKIDEQALNSVAATTGGDSFLALNRDQLVSIYEGLDELETREVQTVSHQPRRDLYVWPLGCAMVLSLIAYGWKPLKEQFARRQPAVKVRLRVNPRTFELETVADLDGVRAESRRVQ